MPRKPQNNAIQADLEEWYQDYDSEEETTPQKTENSDLEEAVEEVRKVLSDSFSLDTIQSALERVQNDPSLAIGLLLDEAAERFQSSLPDQLVEQSPNKKERLVESTLDRREDGTCIQQKEKTTETKQPTTKLQKEEEHTGDTMGFSETVPTTTESIYEEQCKNPVILVLGQVDVGKSTFLGHILHLTGNIHERVLRKLKKESLDSGRSDLSYAWVLDDQEAERERGVTMDISIRQVEYGRLYTFMDTPGHYDFLSAVIAAASQAQIAILLVDASPGQFEASFSENGPSLEHAIIIRSMGVNKVIVAVNKMDRVDYAEERFVEIRNQVTKILTSQIGYTESQISCVPCSGLTGENILQRNDCTLSSWYTKSTIMETLDKFCNEALDDIQDSCFRMSCMDIVEEKKDSETLHISGCIMSGKVKVGDTVQIHPSPISQNWRVDCIKIGEHRVSQAVTGDWTNLLLNASSSGIARVGQVLTSPNATVTQGRYITAHLVMLASGKKPILKGTPVLLHIHCFQGVGVVMEWTTVRRKDPVSKKMTQVDHPRFLKKGDRATVCIRTEVDVFCTPYVVNKKLSRICIRQERQLIATGVVSNVE